MEIPATDGLATAVLPLMRKLSKMQRRAVLSPLRLLLGSDSLHQPDPGVGPGRKWDPPFSTTFRQKFKKVLFSGSRGRHWLAFAASNSKTNVVSVLRG